MSLHFKGLTPKVFIQLSSKHAVKYRTCWLESKGLQARLLGVNPNSNNMSCETDETCRRQWRDGSLCRLIDNYSSRSCTLSRWAASHRWCCSVSLLQLVSCNDCITCQDLRSHFFVCLLSCSCLKSLTYRNFLVCRYVFRRSGLFSRIKIVGQGQGQGHANKKAGYTRITKYTHFAGGPFLIKRQACYVNWFSRFFVLLRLPCLYTVD